MALVSYPIPYHHDSACLFARMQTLDWPMFLDSGQAIRESDQQPGNLFGRYDILVANPVTKFITLNNNTTIIHQGQTSNSSLDPFLLVKQALLATPTSKCELPFSGGALGYFAYDLGRYTEKLPTMASNDIEMPEMLVGIYDWAVIVDHRQQTCALVSHQHYTNTNELEHIHGLLLAQTNIKHDGFNVETDITSNFSEAEYHQAFEKVHAYISQGDCYQVNLAQRFSAQVTGDGWSCYQKIRSLSAAPFMAYMNLSYTNHHDNKQKNIQVLSASPERFLQSIAGAVETRPIKGTRPRFTDPKLDLGSAIELLTSFKDRAENVMIVDLLRNDIGKVCKIGSVKAEKLFNLQSFANVHHLVSYVTGQLKSDKTAIDLLRSCFPGGSITGAPKLRAMEIIEELEPHRRGLYCGSIGYIGFDGDMDTNIAIRTSIIKDGAIYFYAGGGIVTDSTADKEFKETFDKASIFFTTMQYFMRN